MVMIMLNRICRHARELKPYVDKQHLDGSLSYS